MRIEQIETGKTVDAAIESACEKLGCQREDCEWEILDLPKKTMFGLKTTPARVRVAVDKPDSTPPAPERKPQAPGPKPQAAPQQPSPEQPKQQPRQESPKPRQDKQPKPQPRKPQQETAAKSDDREDSQPGEGFAEKEAAVKEYLSGVLEAFGLTAKLDSRWDHGGLYINLTGDGLGVIIGRRGETLDALQYLASLIANRLDGDYLRLTVDCGDYRFKRKDTLEALAKKLAAQVLKTNVSKTLEPMNPFERRIIHATVSEIEGVSSTSIGEEPNRRVVITSPSAKQGSRSGRSAEKPEGGRRPREQHSGRSFIQNRPESDNYETEPERGGRPERGSRPERGGRPERSSRGPRDRDRGRGGRDGRGARTAAPVPSGPPKKTPESETTGGIAFGKIDLE